MAYNTKRYEVVGDWSEHDSDEVSRVLVADLRDKRNGDTFRDGAWRIVDKSTGRIVRTFFGEVAWSDAERLFHDRYWRTVHARAGL